MNFNKQAIYKTRGILKKAIVEFSLHELVYFTLNSELKIGKVFLLPKVYHLIGSRLSLDRKITKTALKILDEKGWLRLILRGKRPRVVLYESV